MREGAAIIKVDLAESGKQYLRFGFFGQGGLIMTTKTQMVIDALAEELRLPKESVLAQGLKTFLERNLREIKVEIFQITGKYGVSCVEEMETRYKQGTLEEEDTWRDFQRLDHLEYKREHLEKLLKELW